MTEPVYKKWARVATSLKGEVDESGKFGNISQLPLLL